MIKTKKGSITVFIMIFFITLLSLIFAFIHGSKLTAVKGAVSSLSGLWGDSILGEYDQNLQGRYNLFGFYAMPADVNEKIDFYAEESLKGKKYIDYRGCNSSLFDYSLANVEVFQEQVIAVGKLIVAGKIVDTDKEIVSAEQNQKQGIINNKGILKALPSGGSKKSVSISGIADSLKNLTSIKDAVKTTGERYLENQYLFRYFRNHFTENDVGKTFFQGEIEYIICGKNSDTANVAAVKRKIVGIREVINLAYLLTDTKKSGAAMVAAELLTPGPAAILTHKGILAAWALAESYNDYQLLIHGKSIPLKKEERTWAVDLDSVLNYTSNGYIDSGINEGEGYGDYLNILLCSMDSPIKLLRMMDLVQINMKYLYYNSFLLREYNGGVRFVLTINGEEYAVDKKYEKGRVYP